VPAIARHVPRKALFAAGFVLWGIFVASRFAERAIGGIPAVALELAGMNWLGTLFLLFVCLLAMDIATAFGFLFRRAAPSLRGWALLAGALLAVVAMVQGLRPPVVENHEVTLPGLPPDADGLVLVAVSDLHLGTLLDEGWLEARCGQIRALRPDLVVFLGDIVEGHGRSPEAFLPSLRGLTAPLGVWAVSGNHESHGGNTPNSRLLTEAGVRVLRNRWAEARPGLLLAGVEDLTSRRRSGQGGDPVGQALAGRPPGAAILLSHTPWEAEKGAAAGAGLMLSGHTHAGQIWPLGYLVRLVYPLLAGRYEVGGMPVIVCRGTGTWGPRMRLWLPGEILRITLRSPGTSGFGFTPSGGSRH
jgi:hypothetical protein